MAFAPRGAALGQAVHQGQIVGFVSARETGDPLPYADVTAEPSGLARFANGAGRFQLENIEPGPLRLRVRRLGFSPATVTVVATGGVDTVRVSLSALALQLDRVRVSDMICPNRAATADASVVAILEQVQLNAERNRLLVRDYTFESILERTIADEWTDEALFSERRRRKVARVDTLTLPSEHEWRYAPGNLIVRSTGGLRDVDEQMNIPQLVDFADEAFIAAHCFRYAGVTTLDGRRLVRVDFEPTRAVRDPDVHGSLYLDARTYQIHRSTLILERPSPIAPARDFWTLQVETWFREVLNGLPVIDRICATTTARSGTAGSSARDARGRRLDQQASVEAQRLLDLRFIDTPPGDPGPVRATPSPACWTD